MPLHVIVDFPPKTAIISFVGQRRWRTLTGRTIQRPIAKCMAGVTRKTEIGPINGTPEKRMFWSIISDYNLRTGLCELVDNAVDLWKVRNQTRALKVEITLDVNRQLISVIDNAGGVKLDDLRLLLAPGGSRNDPDAELIGIFGVGSKRAGIALGEEVQIRTRFGNERSLEIDITKEWLRAPDWELAAYEIPDFKPRTTAVDISYLRKPFTQQDVDEIIVHLGETYDWFLQQGCTIAVNGNLVSARSFETWAFPSRFPPRTATFSVNLADDGKITAAITAGLVRDRNPEADNYGVYFYCNHRLIVKELKTRDVGYFVTTEAGVPHPDASLCRAIVRLQGPAKLMPWNSSKSDINSGHQAFQLIRPTLIQLVSYFSSLSRRLKANWDGKVFRYTTGEILEIKPEDVTAKYPLVLPPLPRVNKPHVEKLKSKNKAQIRDQPWTLGLVEALGAVEIITRQRLETKNRIALILLDSNFEIALKEFIVHRHDLFPAQQFPGAAIQALFGKRHQVVAAVTAKIAIPKRLLDKAQHYYELRNKLIHERATVSVTDTDVDNYRSTIEKILGILFKLKF
jgi:hypothetical protein